ncbi:MAG: Glycosyl transferase group 1, partial [Candidatus Woesebacteria bacterium GW2011_GWB1_39_10b]
RGKYDLVVVGYSDWRFPVLLARVLFRCPLIWDAFYSLYDTYVFDRKLFSPLSVKAAYYWLMDWLCCKIASRILLDTNAHINYFAETFHINKSKFIRSFVGASDDIFYPMIAQENHERFNVLFFGNFIPLQGVQFIIRAAKLLEHDTNINFNIIGSGQTYHQARVLANDLRSRNITFHERQPMHELTRSIARADVCLGIFGETGKTQRVIPNKVYEAIAMKKPMLTADTPAIRELFIDHENILLCRAADPEDLANKIRILLHDTDLCEHISAGAYKIYQANCTPAIIGTKLLGALK